MLYFVCVDFVIIDIELVLFFDWVLYVDIVVESCGNIE